MSNEPFVVIDVKRMESALSSPAFTMSSNMTREQQRQWICDCASGNIEPDFEGGEENHPA